MKARSLRLRLLLGATAAVFAALAMAWFAMTLLFERHIERRVMEDLTREGLQVASTLAIGPNGAPIVVDRAPSDPRFETPASGLYWQASNGRGALRSRSLWDQTLPSADAASTTEWRTRSAPGPFGQSVFILERRVRPAHSGPPLLLQLAYDVAGLHAARAAFARDLALFLCLLWLVLTAAAWAQVRMGLQPFGRVRADLGRLKRSSAERLHGDYPVEIEPLIAAINALADAREVDLTRARRRAADLAHGLKTPVAALAAQSRQAREAGAADAADGLDRAIAAIRGAVEAELARTRIANIREADSLARPVIEGLVKVIERTEAAAAIVIDTEVPTDLCAPIAAEDLAELMGALMENAARHAHRRVLITGRSNPQGTRLAVEDDGPGIAAGSEGDAVQRGRRLDQIGSGEGLGLSIAMDLAEATGGRLSLGRSALGGLSAVVDWTGVQAG